MRRGLLLIAAACAAQPSADAPADGEDSAPVGDTPGEDTDRAGDGDSDSDAPTDVGPRVEVALGPSVMCAEPGLRAEQGPFAVRLARREPLPEPLTRLVGGGVVVADLTGDGLDDVFLPGRVDAQLHVARGTGAFEDEAPARLPPVDLSYATAGSAADVDADGDLDLLVLRWDLPNVLLLNDGAGGFTDGTRESGLRGIARSQASAWGDADADGDLDLFVGNYGPHPRDPFAVSDFEVADPSQLWLNDGRGRFTDASAWIPQDVQDAYTFMAGWLDLDDDGRDDLLVINDFGWARANRLLWSRPGGLVEDADDAARFAIPFAGMGLGVGDVNGDEVPDFVQSSWRATSLLVSAPGRRQWFESAEALGLVADWDGDAAQVFGWGTALVDLDSDGDLDVPMNFGAWDEYTRKDDMRDALFVRQPNGTFVDEAEAWGFGDRGAARGLVVADLNDDGWPDLVKRVLDAPTRLYASRCGAAAWLTVVPRAPGSANPFAVGARVRVVAGDRVWNRWIQGGGTGMYGSGPAEAYVGLGDVDRVDDVQVRWPDGTWTSTGPVDARRVLTLVRSR